MEPFSYLKINNLFFFRILICFFVNQYSQFSAEVATACRSVRKIIIYWNEERELREEMPKSPRFLSDRGLCWVAPFFVHCINWRNRCCNMIKRLGFEKAVMYCVLWNSGLWWMGTARGRNWLLNWSQPWTEY